MAENTPASNSTKYGWLAFAAMVVLFLLILSGIFAGFGSFVNAVGSHWVSLMSGLVSVAITFYEKIHQNITKYLLYGVAAGCVFLACFQAWQDEHEKAMNQVTYMRFNPAIPVPIMSLSIFRAGQVPAMNVGMANQGEYLARDATSMIGLESNDLSTPWNPSSTNLPTSEDIENRLFKRMKEDYESHVPHPDHKDYAPHDQTDYETAIYDHALNDGEEKDFENGKKVMYLLGFVKWTDGAGVHEWRLCDLLSQPIPTAGLTLHNCYSHNDFLRKAVD